MFTVMTKSHSLIRIWFASFVISALAYTLLFYINAWLTSGLAFGLGVNWIYLPAGLRLFLTLIFGLPGALGIAFAGFWISYCGELSYDLTVCIGTGLVSGFAPYLAGMIVFRNIQLDADLSNLSLPKLLICIVVYAFLSAGLHQLWYAVEGLNNTGTFNHFVVMFIGDIFGSLLLISLIKSAIDCVKRFKKTAH